MRSFLSKLFSSLSFLIKRNLSGRLSRLKKTHAAVENLPQILNYKFSSEWDCKESFCFFSKHTTRLTCEMQFDSSVELKPSRKIFNLQRIPICMHYFVVGQKSVKNSSFHCIRSVSPKHLTSGEAYLRDLALGQLSS